MVCFSQSAPLCIEESNCGAFIQNIKNGIYSGSSKRGCINEVVGFKRLLNKKYLLFSSYQVITKLSDKRNGIKDDSQSALRSLGTPIFTLTDKT